jgi:hypothetical protein
MSSRSWGSDPGDAVGRQHGGDDEEQRRYLSHGHGSNYRKDDIPPTVAGMTVRQKILPRWRYLTTHDAAQRVKASCRRFDNDSWIVKG